MTPQQKEAIIRKYATDPAFRDMVRQRAPQLAAQADQALGIPAQQPGQQQPGGLPIDSAMLTQGKELFGGIKDLFGGGSSEPMTGGMSMPSPDGMAGMSMEGTGGLPEAPGVMNSSIMGYAAPAAAIAYGAKTGYDFLKGNKLSTPQKLAMALPTAGLSLFSDKLQSAFGFGGKSLKEKEADRSKKVLEKGIMTHYDGKRDSDYRADPALAGAKNARGLNAYDVWGANDIYEMDGIGSDWLGKLSEDQRRTIAQKSTDADMWVHKKGAPRITNKEGFKKIYDEVMGGSPSAYPGASIDPGRLVDPIKVSGMQNLPYTPPKGPNGEDTMWYGVNKPKPLGSAIDPGRLVAAPRPNDTNSAVASRYGQDVASQVAAAQAAGRNVGTGGAGYSWDGKNFVRR